MKTLTSLNRMLRFYGIMGLLALARDILISRIFIDHKIRIIRTPYRVRGKRYIHFGNSFTSGINLRIEAIHRPSNNEPRLTIGDNVKINDYVHIGCMEKITIGNNVLMGSHILIEDHNHGRYSGAESHDSPETPPDERPLYSRPIVIHDNVWIGEFVSILPGAEIGKGSIIGTMPTVTGQIPPYSVAVGTPARVIKRFDREKNQWIRV